MVGKKKGRRVTKVHEKDRRKPPGGSKGRDKGKSHMWRQDILLLLEIRGEREGGRGVHERQDEEWGEEICPPVTAAKYSASSL